MQKYKFNLYFKLNWFYNIYLRNNKLKASEISLYLALLNVATHNSYGIANINQKNLSVLCGINKNSITKNIDKLVELALVRVKAKNSYEIVLEDKEICCDFEKTNNFVLEHDKPRKYDNLFDDLDSIAL